MSDQKTIHRHVQVYESTGKSRQEVEALASTLAKCQIMTYTDSMICTKINNHILEGKHISITAGFSKVTMIESLLRTGFRCSTLIYFSIMGRQNMWENIDSAMIGYVVKVYQCAYTQYSQPRTLIVFKKVDQISGVQKHQEIYHTDSQWKTMRKI